MKNIIIGALLASSVISGGLTQEPSVIATSIKIDNDKIALERAKTELLRMEVVNVNFDNLTELSYINEKELKDVLKIVKGGEGLASYASYFVEAERKYKVNAIFLTALAAQESGWGKYPAGNGTNITGYAVYNSYSEGTTFKDGVRENILETARLLSEDYLSKDGINFNGTSIEAVNKKYCLKQDMKTIDYNWSKKIRSIGNDIKDTYHETQKVFPF